MGNSPFAASMSANLIDFPPGRKKRWPFQGIPFLPKDLVLPTQPLQLGRDSALRHRRRIDSAPIPASTNPPHQRRQANPEIAGNLALRPPAGQRQAHRFVLKFLRKPSLLHRRVPLRSTGTLHFSEASPLSLPRERVRSPAHLRLFSPIAPI